MRTGVTWIGAATAAALLATSMPATARPRYGYYPPGYGHGWHGDYGRRRHRDGFDFGDFLLGAVVAGGIVAAVASARKDKNGRPRDDRASAPPRLDGEQNAAADACADAAERQAGGDARVTDVRSVSRDGDGWRVEGTIASGDDRSYRDERGFQCGVRYGRVDFVQIGDELAVR